MKKLILSVCLLSLSSCSVIMAGSKDTKPIEEDEAKAQLTRANFEKEISSNIVEEENFDNIDIITYSLTYDKAAKYRMVTHAALDIVTIGIWELFATVGEANTNPTFYYVDVTYDKGNNIKAVDIYYDPENTKSTGD
tara:strand:+ start:4203 stop:4613 length:411 start_codon:yes stop_codon:yes gene_type:complete